MSPGTRLLAQRQHYTYTVSYCSFVPFNRRYLLVSFVMVNVIFLVINIATAVVCPLQDAHQIMVIVRVVVNGLLFVLVGIVLCVCIIKVCIH